MKIGIEIFPALKSCDQGCSTCPLANRGDAVTATSIDTEVQQTFTFLEEKLKGVNALYDLHLSSTFNLMPTVQYPELIEMARFTTNKATIGLNENPEKFSNDIHTLITKTGMSPKTIGYSIVPLSPAVSKYDIDLIRRINDRIQNWHFLSPHKEIEVTIRSNLIKRTLYENILPQAFAADFTLVKGLVEEFAKESRSMATIEDRQGSSFYAILFRGVHKNRMITIADRIITNKKTSDSTKEHIDQWHLLFPHKSSDIQDFAIAPKGVMLMHWSVAINNPILWITHKDFRDSLQIEVDLKKSKFSSWKFMQRLMDENIIMYQNFIQAAKRGGYTQPINFMESYQNLRLSFREEMGKK